MQDAGLNVDHSPTFPERRLPSDDALKDIYIYVYLPPRILLREREMFGALLVPRVLSPDPQVRHV